MTVHGIAGSTRTQPQRKHTDIDTQTHAHEQTSMRSSP